MPGQPQLGSNPMESIDCSAVNIIDLDGQASTVILTKGNQYRAQVNLTTAGPTLQGLITAGVLRYEMRVFAESIGGGPEGTLLTQSGAVPNLGNFVINTPNTNVPNVPDGVYELAVTVRLVVGGAGIGVVAFNRGPVVEIVSIP